MKVIFLDVDGVLNSRATRAKSPSGFVGIGDVFVRQLSELVAETGAKIVLSSDWKDGWEQKHRTGKYLEDKLAKYGLSVFARTYDSDYRKRGQGICDYLEGKNIEGYVILDDRNFDFIEAGLEAHFVRIDARYGLRDCDIHRAKQIINNELCGK